VTYSAGRDALAGFLWTAARQHLAEASQLHVESVPHLRSAAALFSLRGMVYDLPPLTFLLVDFVLGDPRLTDRSLGPAAERMIYSYGLDGEISDPVGWLAELVTTIAHEWAARCETPER
jgi:hypothetical protein